MKKTAIAVLIIIGIVIIAALAAPALVDADKFRSTLSAKLERATGYRIALAGDISFKLLPNVSFKADKVSVASPASPKTPFATVESLDVGVALMPILHGEVEVTRVALKDPVITLVRRANGQTSWASGLPADAPAKKEEKSAVSEEKSKPANVIFHDISIDNGSLSYRDETKRQKIELAELNLDAGAGALSGPFKLKADAMLNGRKIMLNAEARLAGIMDPQGQSPLRLAFKSELANLTLDGDVENQEYRGPIAFDTNHAGKAANWLTGVEGAKDGRKMAVSLKGAAQCSKTRCELGDATIGLGDTTLSGKVGVLMKTAPITVNADLSTRMLDVTPFLEQKSARLDLGLVRSAIAQEARWSAEPIDLSILNALNANLALKADRFVARQFAADAVDIHAKLSGGSLASTIGSSALYGGKGTANVNLSSGGALRADIDAAGVKLKPMLDAMSDNNRFSGTGNLKLNLNSQGKSQRQLISGLGGSGEVRVRDGSIRGIDIAGMVKNVKSAFDKSASGSESTDFTEAGGTFIIASGIISNNDLSIKAPLFRVGGKGTVNLPAYRIDYLLDPKLVESLKGQDGKDKAGVGVPIRVSGPLDHPSYAPDFQGTIEEAIKDPKAFKENLKQNKDAIKDLLKEGKGLFKGL